MKGERERTREQINDRRHAEKAQLTESEQSSSAASQGRGRIGVEVSSPRAFRLLSW